MLDWKTPTIFTKAKLAALGLTEAEVNALLGL